MYLVTGASGNVGRALVTQLSSSGEEVRAFTRDPARLAVDSGAVQVAAGDFRSPETFSSACTGVDAAFIMNGGPDIQTFEQLLSAARAAGVRRVVFLSTLVADEPDSPIGQHHRLRELAIESSGVAAVHLRPGGFMSNATLWAESIVRDGAVRNAMGQGRYAPIAPEDVAAVAARALRDEALSGAIPLTGGALVSVPEQVEILARVLGRPLRCIDVPIDEAVAALVRAGTPPPIAAAVGQSFAAVRDGRTMTVSDRVSTLLGRPPMTFEAWARLHRDRFI